MLRRFPCSKGSLLVSLHHHSPPRLDLPNRKYGWVTALHKAAIITGVFLKLATCSIYRIVQIDRVERDLVRTDSYHRSCMKLARSACFRDLPRSLCKIGSRIVARPGTSAQRDHGILVHRAKTPTAGSLSRGDLWKARCSSASLVFSTKAYPEDQRHYGDRDHIGGSYHIAHSDVGTHTSRPCSLPLLESRLSVAAPCVWRMTVGPEIHHCAVPELPM